MKLKHWMPVLATLLAIQPLQAAAQQTPQVEGTVTDDQSGAPVVGVEFAVVDHAARAVTDEQGRFTLVGMTPGRYVLIATRIGYEDARSEVEVPTSGAARLDLAMAARAIPLPDVTVNALRAQVSGKTGDVLLDVPQPITIVDAELVKAQGGRTMRDYMRNVAGVVQSSGGSSPSQYFALRGFYSDANGNFRKNGAQILKSAELVQPNVERVEVLKGPVSVLFGHLDPGGVINVVTKKPEHVQRSTLTLRGGSFGHAEGHLDVTGPIGQTGTLAYRLNAAGERGGQFPSAVGYDKLFAAPALRWTPGGRARIDVEVEASRGTGTDYPGLSSPDGTSAGLDRLPSDLFLGESDAAYERDQLSGTVNSEFTIGGATRVGANLAWSNYDWASTSVSLGSFDDDDRTLSRSASRREIEQTDAHADVYLLGRTNLGPTSHQWTLGGDLQASSLATDNFGSAIAPVDVTQPTESGIPTLPATSGGSSDNTVSGVYFNDRIRIGRLHLSGGIRYTSFRQESDVQEISAEDWSGNAGALFSLTEEGSIYASYSQSFAPTLFTRNGQFFDPSYGEQWEAGVKLGLAGGRLLATASVFDLENTGVLSFIQDSEGNWLVEQGGLHGSRGLELELSGQPHATVFVTAAYAYLNGEVRDDPAYAAGTPLGGAPKHSANLWVQVRATERLELGGGINHRSEMKSWLSSRLFMPAYTLLDASAAFDVTPSLQVRVALRNLTDARYYTGSSGIDAWVGTPRSLQMYLTTVLE
ncbi:MAG: TonB-dependent receptor [Gemmatimonadota bacterium]|uniref:TonB-dependent receptor n=1 Tax=Candidatus Palauibacter scopulicola TaxID=3056741 RepID=UPI00239E7FC7|nr:TonB-dependent receptor [Candidatus Palauibacter scopulicola]MDE2662154.1 TonB-dependent receptor [Candidatus Palauibacter scopulicola]